MATIPATTKNKMTGLEKRAQRRAAFLAAVGTKRCANKTLLGVLCGHLGRSHSIAGPCSVCGCTGFAEKTPAPAPTQAPTQPIATPHVREV